MKKLRKLFVLLLLVMTSAVANGQNYYYPLYQNPIMYEVEDGHVVICGLDMNTTEKTLVIPNKIGEEWVEEIVDRQYRYHCNNSWGYGTVKYSLFKYNCPKDDAGRIVINPYVDPDHCYNKGEQPTGFDESVLGQKLQLEEIVLPYKVGAIWNHAYFRNIPTLKKIYLRAGYIGNFNIDLTGSPFVEEIHLMCWDTPRYSIDGTKIPVNPLYPGRKIKLYVPENQYIDYLERDTRWANNPYFELMKEPENPTDGATLKIKNTYPNVTVSLGIFNIKGREGSEYVETFKYPRYYMPLCEVSHQGKGKVKVKLNGQYIEDCIDWVSPLELVPGENILEVEFITSSDVTIASNGNGASVKWNGFNDPRGGGHFSGRLTLPLVAAGVIAKKQCGFSFHADLVEIGGETDKDRWPDLLDATAKEGDSLGGIVECHVDGVPAGLGEPFFDSVESLISHAVFSIPGVRGIEFGDGFAAARLKGSEHNDSLVAASLDGQTTATLGTLRGGTGASLCEASGGAERSEESGLSEPDASFEVVLPKRNGAGGVNGGITNGAPIVFRVAFKPTSSIAKAQKTLNIKTGEMTELKIKGRHDVCFALRTPVIVEAVAAIVLADQSL